MIKGKNIIMNFNKITLLSLLAGVLFFTACTDEDLAPIVTFDSAGKGAYVRLVSESGEKLVNLFDVAGSSYTYTVEFVDPAMGGNVAQYVLELTFDDNDPDNGDNGKGPIEYLSFDASQFTTNGDGFQGVENIAITGPEILTALGISEDDVSPGDVFEFEGKLLMNDGGVFTGSNSSSTVNGAAFKGHFDFDLNAACPSSLAGTYDYELQAAWTGFTDVVTGQVDVIAEGGGVYHFSDASLGAYGVGYGAGVIANSPNIEFTDLCAVVSFTGLTDAYGDIWEFTSELSDDKTRWTIEWLNTTYVDPAAGVNESGTTVLINSNGWDFDLK